jgi:hypothetical protein
MPLPPPVTHAPLPASGAVSLMLAVLVVGEQRS